MKSKLPPSVKQFKSADECLDQKGLEAVLIASETSLHAELAKKAMDRGLVSVLSHDIERSRWLMNSMSYLRNRFR
jgi:predicted dehydrogenase